MRNSIQLREEENFELMLEYAHNAGFKEIAVGFGSSKLFLNDNYEKRIDDICNMLAKYDMKCTQTHFPYYFLLISAEEVDEEVEKSIVRCIHASSVLGADWIAYHPRSDVSGGFNRKTSYEYNLNDLKRYLEYAHKYNVGIAVENMPLFPYNNPEWRFYGGCWEDICELCDELDSDKIGICWDFGHAHTANIDQGKAFEAIGEKLKITHVHDNYKNGDHHQLPLLAGMEWGCIDWKKTMQSLKGTGYCGPLTLELIFPPEPMLESFVKCGYECLSHLWNIAGSNNINR